MQHLVRGSIADCANGARSRSNARGANNSDLDFYAQGYVTIVPFVPDITAQNPLVFKSILPGFAP